MNTFEFFGYSDDLFCVTGSFSEEQDDCANQTKMSYLLSNGDEKVMIVSGQYGIGGDCWAITIEPLCESLLPLKDWSFKYNPKDYGVSFIVKTPENIDCSIFKES